MGNTQANEKSKTGKSPAKGKHFMRNLNRKSSGRESKKHGRKKSDLKRDAIEIECDKAPDSDNNEPIETSDNDTVECASKTSRREGSPSVQSEVTVGRCGRSPTRLQPAAGSPSTDSVSVFTEPLTPLAAVELNQCYYSAESDSAPEELPLPALALPNMPHHDASSIQTHYEEKQINRDVFDDSASDRGENEKVMGAIWSRLFRLRNEQLEKNTHECNHDFLDNRLKACPERTSFTVSKHRKVELPPVACEPSLALLENEVTEKDRRHSSLSDAPLTESNVLRKVASLTLDKLSEAKIVRPKFVPDKLDFRLYEKFEGQMLLNWFMSSIAENNLLKNVLNTQDQKNLGIQYCTYLLAAGVLRQIADKDAPSENTFKPNLMYYWAHMEAPASQPVTPGRLHMSAWPPDKDTYSMHAQLNNRLDNKLLSQNNNEEVSNLSEANFLISQLRIRLQEAENKIEKLKINMQIDSLNRNLEKSFDTINEYNLSRKCDLISKEASNLASEQKLSNTPVINLPEYDTLRTNVNNEKRIDISSLELKNEMVKDESKPDVRSEKIENYCKLNKSRDCNEIFQRDEKVPTKIHNELGEDREKGPTVESTVNATHVSDSSSEGSFRSSYASTDLIREKDSYSELLSKEVNVKQDTKTEFEAQVLYTIVDNKTIALTNASHTSLELSNNLDSSIDVNNTEYIKAPMTQSSDMGRLENDSTEALSSDSFAENLTGSQVPPLPGISPPPPPMPGTDKHACRVSEVIVKLKSESPISPSEQDVEELIPTDPPMPCKSPPPPAPPPMPCLGPPPPPMPSMGPPPPPIPCMGPPPPPMPCMGPPPPPMPETGPPPPPMPGMGPPPPPMPGMGPPPPPMPGLMPPPPPMPGMMPPPPPMPGMMPPPPPMPGMPHPPPMFGSNPPPPPMPGTGPPPPPPSSGPVPFPAPPVGGWNMQRATLRKTPVKPTAPMKPLYWTRILAQPAHHCQGESDSCFKPLWLEIEETSLDNIDEFTDLFSRQVVKAPVKKKVEVKTKIQPVKILDSKRSQNVGILAQSLHVEFSEIENAIYNFDTSIVTLEALQQIYELRATDEELAMIKAHLATKPEIPLDKPEAFLHDLSGIPNFAERISCFMFQAEFEDAVSTTMHKLDNLKHTCEFLMTSEPLKKVFAIILTLGNYMNGGNGQRGQADGFGLEILSKLKDVKSKQSNVTLLHFIVRTYMRSAGLAGSGLAVPEPGDVARAAALDFADVAHSLQTLTTQLTACKEKTKKVIETDAQSRSQGEESPAEGTRRLEVFKDKMTMFLNAAEDKLKTENDNLEECRAKFIATVKFYQYTPKCGKLEDCEPKEFFSLWTSFCSDFKDIYKKEEQLAIKEKLKEAKKMQEERKSLTQPKKEGGLKSRLQKLSSCRK